MMLMATGGNGSTVADQGQAHKCGKALEGGGSKSNRLVFGMDVGAGTAHFTDQTARHPWRCEAAVGCGKPAGCAAGCGSVVCSMDSAGGSAGGSARKGPRRAARRAVPGTSRAE